MHPSNREALLNLLGNPAQPSVVIVPTGWDTYPEERKSTELNHVLTTFKEFGFTTSELSLTNATKETTFEALKDKNLVWVMAGNTFYLNFHMHQSGFSEVIKDLLESGLVYGGESAGAVVAGVTLHGVERVDDPKESPETIWEGLALVDCGIIPHWGWEKYEEPLISAKNEMAKSVEVKTLTNDQALIVTNGRKEVIQNPSNEA
jgi:dipeptidase E